MRQEVPHFRQFKEASGEANPSRLFISYALSACCTQLPNGTLRAHEGCREMSRMRVLKDAGHLFRFAGLFVVAFLVFLLVRGQVVPKSFGEYGHYRGDAIRDIAARPIRFAGHQACETCHTDVQDVKQKGKHAGVNCEACHGPLAKHAADPSVTPATLDTAVLCVRCHSASAARPMDFGSVQSFSHFRSSFNSGRLLG
jgi:uncharacterized CHY-type Zn-finger protein